MTQSLMKLGIRILSKMTLRITRLSEKALLNMTTFKMTFGRMAFSRMSLNLMTLYTTTLSRMTLSRRYSTE
jgi:hypothetical protein